MLGLVKIISPLASVCVITVLQQRELLFDQLSCFSIRGVVNVNGQELKYWEIKYVTINKNNY